MTTVKELEKRINDQETKIADLVVKTCTCCNTIASTVFDTYHVINGNTGDLHLVWTCSRCGKSKSAEIRLTKKQNQSIKKQRGDS